MTAFNRLAAATIVLMIAACTGADDSATTLGSIDKPNRAEANQEKDEARNRPQWRGPTRRL